MCSPRDIGDVAGTYEVRLPAEVKSPMRARAAVAEQCAAWGLDGVSDDASLIVSELVSNAVHHAGTSIVLALAAYPGLLRLEVTDGSTRPLQSRTPTMLAEGGRGLFLVDALSSHYGVEGRPDGKTVWAELSTNRATQSS